ncbi:MAG: thioredoxin family protein [Rhodobacteraceae bacterium]|nr:thioredoxin family protein [Paracoccaceae bacterium]
MLNLCRAICVLASVTALTVMSAAHAQNFTRSVETENSRATLLIARTSAAPGSTVWAALKLELAPGWHTYWRNPGDSGLPGGVSWTLPEGMTNGEIAWPAPERAPYGPLMNFGFHDQVILPVPLTVSSGAPTGMNVIRADANWLVCADVCIPDQATLEIPFAVGVDGTPPPTGDADEIAAAIEKIPLAIEGPVTIARAGDEWRVDADLGEKLAVSDAFFFPNDGGVIENVAPQTFEVAGSHLKMSIKADTFTQDLPASVAGVVALETVDGLRALSISAPVTVTVTAAAPEPLAAPATDVGLIAALAFAFLGGLILNLMPCVLPVLAMKAMSLAKGSEHAKRDGLAYTAGVMVTFGVLAGVLGVLRQSGTQWGWGFQLQEPLFVCVMAAIVLCLGLMLSGVFTFGGGVMGVGQSLTARGGASGAFFTGALAVVVATPCTAPFMGTAMIYALTQPMAVTVMVFEALALGMATPFLAVSTVPAFARALPKPGAWMDTFKQVLAFPMYATAAWLVWVMAQQLGPDGLAAAFAVLVLTAFSAWALGRVQSAGRAGGAAAAGLVAMLGIVALIPQIANSSPPMTAAPVMAVDQELAVEPYSAERLATLRRQNRPVFVNFTAAWCITCLMNERVALSRPAVIEAMAAADVAYLKGDWTNRDAAIGAALASYGRSGVPLYLYFAAGADKPLILPQILTPDAVIDVVRDDSAARVAGG